VLGEVDVDSAELTDKNLVDKLKECEHSFEITTSDGTRAKISRRVEGDRGLVREIELKDLDDVYNFILWPVTANLNNTEKNGLKMKHKDRNNISDGVWHNVDSKDLSQIEKVVKACIKANK
jgi:hypothetical protein